MRNYLNEIYEKLFFSAIGGSAFGGNANFRPSINSGSLEHIRQSSVFDPECNRRVEGSRAKSRDESIKGDISDHSRSISGDSRSRRVFQSSLNNKKGNILIFSYFIIGLLLIFGGVFISRAFTELRTAKMFESSAQAFQAAEAGLAEAYWRLNNLKPLPEEAVNIASDTTATIYGIEQGLANVRITMLGKSSTPAPVSDASDNIPVSKQGEVYLTRDVMDAKFSNAVTGKSLRVIGIGPKLRGDVRIRGDVVLGWTVDNPFPGVNFYIDGKLTENALAGYTVINFYDENEDGVVGQGDFVKFYDALVEQLKEDKPEEVVVINASESVVVVDTGLLGDAKLVYVRNASFTDGKVILRGTMPSEGDLSVVTDGKIEINNLTGGIVKEGKDKPTLAAVAYNGITQMSAKTSEQFEAVLMSLGGDITVQSPASIDATIISGKKDIVLDFKDNKHAIEIEASTGISKGKKPLALNSAAGLKLYPFGVLTFNSGSEPPNYPKEFPLHPLGPGPNDDELDLFKDGKNNWWEGLSSQ